MRKKASDEPGEIALAEGDVLRISDSVLADIAFTEAMSVPGVHPAKESGLHGVLRKPSGGIAVRTGEGEVAFDITVGVRHGARIPHVAREVRRNVIYAVQLKTGYTVREVNILVDHFVVAEGELPEEETNSSEAAPQEELPGRLEIAPTVFSDLVRRELSATPEVAGLAKRPGGLFRRGGAGEDVAVECGEGELAIAAALTVRYDVRIPDLVDGLRRRVRAAIEEMTGYRVRAFHVTIENILPPEPPQPEAAETEREPVPQPPPFPEQE